VFKVAGGGGSGGILRLEIGVEFAGRCDSVIYLQINLRFVKTWIEQLVLVLKSGF
jgi:hypothetical protein